jgi:hypothetical protein
MRVMMMPFSAAISKLVQHADMFPCSVHLRPWFVCSAVLGYVALCLAVRFRRVHRRALDYPDRKSLSSMTTVAAQSIIMDMAEWEFPTLFERSLQFALFKVSSLFLPHPQQQ